MTKLEIDIRDEGRCYYSDEVTCFEKPLVVLLDYINNDFGKIFLIVCKAMRLYNYTHCTSAKREVKKFIKDNIGVSVIEAYNVKCIIKTLINELEQGNVVLMGGNLFELPYSKLHYQIDDCVHLFVVKGYNASTKMFTVLDNSQLATSEYEEKDKRYCDFYLSEQDIERLYESYKKKFGDRESLILYRKNKNYGKYTEKEILIAALEILCKEKKHEKFRQLEKLKDLERSLQACDIEKERIKFLSKKILNQNKYKNVLLNEIKMFMKKYEYPDALIYRIDLLKEEIYALWMNYVTISISKIKRKVNLNELLVSDELENKEAELTELLYVFLNYIKDDEWKRNDYIEKKNFSNDRNRIIELEHNKIGFKFVDGKTYNYWIEDFAPKYVLQQQCKEKEISISTNVIVNPKSAEEKYQAGIYIRNNYGKTYFASLEGIGKCILDTIGENNFSENFVIPTNYCIKVKICDDYMCAKYEVMNNLVKEMKIGIERGDSLEIGLMVKTWGNGEYLDIVFEDISIQY